MGRQAKQSVDRRIPALVFVKTKETVIVDGEKVHDSQNDVRLKG